MVRSLGISVGRDFVRPAGRRYLGGLRSTSFYLALVVLLFESPFFISGAHARNRAVAHPGREPVLSADVRLEPVQTEGRQVVAAITGYEMDNGCPYGDPKKCQVPLYTPYNRDDPRWWDNLLEELMYSRVHVVMLHGRGCLDPDAGFEGIGNMCPRLLKQFVEAVDRADARAVIRVAMWDDTGAYPGAYQYLKNIKTDVPMDLSNLDDAVELFWNRNMRIWFDTLPRDLWYLHDGHPLIAFWSLADAFFQNQKGNAHQLLTRLKALFQERYGIEPEFILDTRWPERDPTITRADALGVNSWFDPNIAAYSLTAWAGKLWSALIPGFRDGDNFQGCGSKCRELPRGPMGSTFQNALDASKNSPITLLEGFTDIAESAGSYRSSSWEYPSLYLNLIREHTDFETKSLRFQAEAADAFQHALGSFLPPVYRSDGLGIESFPQEQGGWYVTSTSAGDWVEFKQVYFSEGDYRFTGRYSGTGDQQASLLIDGTPAGTVICPSTGGPDRFNLIHLGAVHLIEGRHDIRFRFDTGSINLDWIFSRKK